MTDQDPTQRYEAPPVDRQPAVEPAVPPLAVPTVPVTSSPKASPAGPGRSRVRWLVALVATVLVAGTAAGATSLLTRDAGEAEVLAWTPADSVVYTEVRLDLPGGQEAELAKALRALPGFSDQAAFPTKLDEALNQLVKQASNDRMGYQADIQPWFGGQVALSAGPVPKTADAKAARALVIASTKDAAKASAWAQKVLADAGATTSTETYNGVTITTVTPPASSKPAKAGATGAYAAMGTVIALGDPVSVKAAIDTRGTAGLATNAQFRTASASLSGDRLAFTYVDAATLAQGAKTLADAAAPSAMPKLPGVFTDLAAPWGAAAIRAQDGTLVVDTRSPHVAKLQGLAKAAESRLPSVLPPSTVVLVEGQELGEAVQRVKTLAASDPQLADGVTRVDGVLRVVGGLGSIVDWMGEAGVAVTRSGDTVAGGLVILPTDRAAADKLATQLRGFLELGGGAGIKVTDEAYGDATITVVDLGNLGSLAGAATGGALGALPAETRIAYAVTDRVVVLGSGTDFVKAVLDARTGDSLAKSERFSQALARVDKANGSLLWVDVAGVRDLVERQLPAADKAGYEANVKPYLVAFDAVIGTVTPGTDLDRGTFVIIVSRP